MISVNEKECRKILGRECNKELFVAFLKKGIEEEIKETENKEELNQIGKTGNSILKKTLKFFKECENCQEEIRAETFFRIMARIILQENYRTWINIETLFNQIINN